MNHFVCMYNLLHYLNSHCSFKDLIQYFLLLTLHGYSKILVQELCSFIHSSRITINCSISVFIELCTTITCFYSNMTRPMTLWYGKELALFGDIGEDHPCLQVQRVPGA